MIELKQFGDEGCCACGAVGFDGLIVDRLPDFLGDHVGNQPRRGGLEVQHAAGTVLIESVPDMEVLLADATPADRIHGWSGAAGYLRRCWGPGWALVGDAGYFKDPITTHGMTDALRDAELLADAALAVLSGSQEASVMAEYERTRDRLSGDMFNVTEAVAAYDWELDRLRHLLRGSARRWTRK